jgi:hypothetical protein
VYFAIGLAIGNFLPCTVKYYTALKEELPLRTFVAIGFGFLSGAMLFLLVAMLTGYTISSGPTLAVAFVALFAGSAISAYFFRWKAATTSAVLCRGFLLGAAEWLAAAMAAASLIAFAVAYFVGRQVRSDVPPAPSAPRSAGRLT